ncbi:MAG TPA: ABC transporter permease subunit [Spirochaetales bacterium]|nr:ABC transporter permease subunit [Spirochaetales bacterium]HRY53757.1 ABC transporter permease subunit [Spirochaetia bacterium]
MTALAEREAAGPARESEPGPRAGHPRADVKRSLSWLGLVPFFLFAFAFMLLPASSILVGSFQDAEGAFTLANLANLFRPSILNSYIVTIKVSATTALLGGLLGFLIAYAITLGGLPKPLKSFMSTFSGVASNFAGVPLAFAFIATLGRMGVLTVFLRTAFGIELYDAGFNLYSFWGLSLTYTYFQIPLMILIIEPALEGMKREWREAAENLGATSLQYWLKVGLPVLMPAFLAAFILLFGNAFGAYATAYALTGGLINLVTILIGAQVKGNVLHDPNLGYALALGMIIIMTACILAYSWLQKLSSRWVK